MGSYCLEIARNLRVAGGNFLPLTGSGGNELPPTAA
jgi:hypothetical protein